MTRTLQTSIVINDYIRFPYVEQVVRLHYVSTDLKGENRREDTRYLITSLPAEKADSKELLELARGHWSIENSLHWVRDVTFDATVPGGSGTLPHRTAKDNRKPKLPVEFDYSFV